MEIGSSPRMKTFSLFPMGQKIQHEMGGDADDDDDGNDVNYDDDDDDNDEVDR